MPTEADIWTESFCVRAYETDLHGCASIQTLCNYFQTAAGNHTRTYGASIDALNEQGLTWESAELTGKTFAGGLKVASGFFPDVPYLKTASGVASLVVMVFGVFADSVQDMEFDEKRDVDKLLIAFCRPVS